MIQKFEECHIDDVVQIHMHSFPNSQSTKFGKLFLTSYYKGASSAMNTCSFVYIVNNKVAGFIFGGINKQSQSLTIALNSKWSFLKSIFNNFIRQPIATVSKFWNYAIHYILPGTDKFYNDKTATLDSIAILPEFRGKGISDQLMKGFLFDLASRGVEVCRLGVLSDNKVARSFYERSGFEQANEEGTIYLYFFPKTERDKYQEFIKLT